MPLHTTYCSISRKFFSFTRKLIKRGLRRSYVWILEIWIGERVLHREGPRDYWSNIWLQHKIIPIALQIVFALDRIAFHHEISRICQIPCLRPWTCPDLTNVHPMVEWRHCFGECLKYPWYLVYIRRIFSKLIIRPNTHIKITNLIFCQFMIAEFNQIALQMLLEFFEVFQRSRLRIIFPLWKAKTKKIKWLRWML